MVSIIHRIGIKASPAQIYPALASIAGLASWWTNDVSGNPEPGGKIQFVFRAVDGDVKGSMTMQVEESRAPDVVRWRCLEGPAEWIGTDITFELSHQGEQTILLFGHRNWREAVEFTAHCSMKWATFLLSLRDYIETGKGKPSPHDLKIDNWN